MVEKIFIADKTTLGFPNPTSAGTDTVMNYLKKIDDKSNTSTFMLPMKGVSPIFTEMLNIAGKGRLVYAGNVTTGSNSETEIEVYVDEVLVFKAKNGPSGRTSAIVHISMVNGGVPFYADQGSGWTTAAMQPTSLRNLPYILNEEGINVLLSEGLRFDRSLVIKTRAANPTYYAYGIAIVEVDG